MATVAVAQTPSRPGRVQAPPLRPLSDGALLRCGDLDVSVGMEGAVLALVAAGQRYPMQSLETHRGVRYVAMDDFRTVLWDNDGRAMLVLGGQILPECTRRDAQRPNAPLILIATSAVAVTARGALPPLITFAPGEPAIPIAALSPSPASTTLRARTPVALPSLIAFAPAPAMSSEPAPGLLPGLVTMSPRASSRSSMARAIPIASLTAPVTLPPLIAVLPTPRRLFAWRGQMPTIAGLPRPPGAILVSLTRRRSASARPRAVPPDPADNLAVGFSPQWTLRVSDGRISFRAENGPRFSAPAPAPYDAPGARSYAASSEGLLMHVALYDRPCRDVVSGQTLATTVIVRLDGETFNGCGAGRVSPQR